MKKRTIGLSLTVLALAALSLGSSFPIVINPSDAKSQAQKEVEEELKATHLNCLRCKTEMEYGMTLSDSQSASNWQILWSPGIRGLSPFAKTPPQKLVYTFRCPNCGYLESYAK